MHPHLPATVFLNGSAVKQIREDKKLTQLYVSKVVGVTTDTISRWENNRYPTIKRENALLLSEALEVDVNEILIDDPEAAGVNVKPAKRFRVKPLLIGAFIIVLAIIFGVWFFPDKHLAPVFSLTVSRNLPNFAAPGSQVPVRVNFSSPLPSGGYILREYFPKGWKLIQASPPASSLDNINGVVRWIIKAGDSRERIVYMLQIDAAASPESYSKFRGEVIISSEQGQSTLTVNGDDSVSMGPVLWADSNGDSVIDDAEMLQASYTVDEMQGVHIDWGKLEKLWDAGQYHWDEKQKDFLPVR